MYKSAFSMFNLPNLLTISNMLCGLFSVMLALHGKVDIAPYPILLGMIFDFFDGFAARKMKIQGDMGKQLDSLADMITFGVAPGIIMLVVCTYSVSYAESPELWNNVPKLSQVRLMFANWFQNVIQGNEFSILPFFALLIPVFSMLRLAKFNLDTRQSDQFIGLPTPANTLFFCSFPILIFAGFEEHSVEESIVIQMSHPWSIFAIILVMCVLMISELPLLALKFKHFKWSENQLRYVFLITCLLLIVFLRIWSIPIIVILYIFISVIDNITKKQLQ